jgi:Low-density lipoprotein receptor domain class A
MSTQLNNSIIVIFFFSFIFAVRQRTCTERQFQCNNGECIPIKFICDGETDCPEGDDEDPYSCAHKG